MLGRIWDLPPERLCRQHLLGEHRELHGLWNILTPDMAGYRHHSPLDGALADGPEANERRVDPGPRQVELLRAKGCSCQV